MPVSTPAGSASVVATTLSVVPPLGGLMSIHRKSTFTSASNRVSKPSSSKSRLVASWSDTAMATVEIPVSGAVCVVMNGRQLRPPRLIAAHAVHHRGVVRWSSSEGALAPERIETPPAHSPRHLTGSRYARWRSLLDHRVPRRHPPTEYGPRCRPPRGRSLVE